MRAFIEVDDDGIELMSDGLRGLRDYRSNVIQLDAYPCIVEGVVREPCKRAFTPRDYCWVKLDNFDPRRRRQRIEDGSQGEPHAQSADEHQRVRSRYYHGTGEFAERNFGPVCTAVHEHTVVNENDIIALAPAAEFEDAVCGVNHLDSLPWLGQINSFFK